MVSSRSRGWGHKNGRDVYYVVCFDEVRDRRWRRQMAGAVSLVHSAYRQGRGQGTGASNGRGVIVSRGEGSISHVTRVEGLRLRSRRACSSRADC